EQQAVHVLARIEPSRTSHHRRERRRLHTCRVSFDCRSAGPAGVGRPSGSRLLVLPPIPATRPTPCRRSLELPHALRRRGSATWLEQNGGSGAGGETRTPTS